MLYRYHFILHVYICSCIYRYIYYLCIYLYVYILRILCISADIIINRFASSETYFVCCGREDRRETEHCNKRSLLLDWMLLRIAFRCAIHPNFTATISTISGMITIIIIAVTLIIIMSTIINPYEMGRNG